jgi:hypothetical protein
MFLRHRDEDDHNLMEDVPTISINKEELEKHAVQISQYYSGITTRSNCRRALISSLDKSYSQILKTYEYIDREARYKREIVPAAEWMLDNLYLIEKEYKDIKYNMPISYYRGLPVIKKGVMKGYPRVYYLAVELVSHTDGRIDEETIQTFVNAYQRNTVLTMGELWALPIMVKIALIQNISKIAERIVFSQEEKKKGDLLAERFINACNEGGLNEEIEKVSTGEATLSPHFTERFLKVLRDSNIDNAEVYKWLDDRLDLQQTDAEKMIAEEHQKQAGFQISIGNCITSIREAGALNWKENFEKLSIVEKILKDEPAEIYKNMDFESRDYYRHRLEKLAKYTDTSEQYVAKKAVECAQNYSDRKSYKGHIGFYLIDDGIEELKQAVGYRHKKIGSVGSLIRANRAGVYIGTVVSLTVVLCLAAVIAAVYQQNYVPAWTYILVFIALLIPCSEIIVSIMNWSINRLLNPRFVPKMELKDEIPEEFTSIVVIPTLLNNENRVHDLASDLEVYYLANREKNLYFALLGDFTDSTAEHEEKDNSITEAALSDIRLLNEKYAKNSEDVFYFFNRFRQYNEKEGLWLGWERKRGKLEEFNKLLRGDQNTSYNVISGDVKRLQKVKYVITLDADTQLPRDSAKKLIGAMCHVLNRAHINNDIKGGKRIWAYAAKN